MFSKAGIEKSRFFYAETQRGGAATKGLRRRLNPEHREVCQDRFVRGMRVRGMRVRGMLAIPLTRIPLSPGSAVRLENLRSTG